MLTNVPKLCIAPKLKHIRFAYHPLSTIETNAFNHLPSLETLDMAGNGVEPTLNMLSTDALALTATNFSKLSMEDFNSLESFSPRFISNIQPHTILNFWYDNIAAITEDTFRELFELIASASDLGLPSGYINFGRNPLLCDCSIKWIVEDPRMLAVIDWPSNNYDYYRPRCRDGTLVADLDIDILDALCS